MANNVRGNTNWSKFAVSNSRSTWKLSKPNFVQLLTELEIKGLRTWGIHTVYTISYSKRHERVMEDEKFTLTAFWIQSLSAWNSLSQTCLVTFSLEDTHLPYARAYNVRTWSCMSGFFGLWWWFKHTAMFKVCACLLTLTVTLNTCVQYTSTLVHPHTYLEANM